MVSCNSDDAEDEPAGQSTPLHLMPAISSLLEVSPWSAVRATGDASVSWATRATYETTNLPTGYVDFQTLHPTADASLTTIGVFLTPDAADAVSTFAYRSGNDWFSYIPLVEGQQYYIYGFMPHYASDGATITSLNGTGGSDYANGAVITIPNFSTITTADVCAVAGVRKGIDDELIDNLQDYLVLGQFAYQVAAEGENTIFVLLRHLYASLRFRLNIDAEYHRLRSIYVTKMELEAMDIPGSGTLTITLTANDDGNDPVTSAFTPDGGASQDLSITLYDANVAESNYTPTNKPGMDLPELIPEEFLGCFVPGQCASFRLKTTYDVYDRKGNLIRKQCTAENTFSISTISEMVAGDVYTLHITVNPTFLYVLSDPDLDNPTFEIK
jgi:hypothetical protein